MAAKVGLDIGAPLVVAVVWAVSVSSSAGTFALSFELAPSAAGRYRASYSGLGVRDYPRYQRCADVRMVTMIDRIAN